MRRIASRLTGRGTTAWSMAAKPPAFRGQGQAGGQVRAGGRAAVDGPGGVDAGQGVIVGEPAVALPSVPRERQAAGGRV